MTRVQATPAHALGGEPARAMNWLRANAVVIAAVVLIGISVWWRAALLARSFFRLDDFIYLSRAAHSSLTWKYLLWVDAGHLTPLGNVIAWCEVRLSPADWTLTSAVTLGLLAISGLALLRMLRALFGDHPGILVPLVLYLLSPLAISGLSWWTVTLELLPLQAAIFLAVTSHVKFLRTGSARYVAETGGWLFIAMASSLRGAGIAVLLLGVTSAFFEDGPWPRSVWSSLRRYWPAWVLYSLITAGYLVLYWVQLATSSVAPGRPGSFTGVFEFASTLVRDTFVPGILGGPWRWTGAGVYASANPPGVLAAASWVIAAIVIVVSVFYRPRAWRAWAILVGWLIVVDMVPVLLGRSVFVPGVLLGLVTRYVWDATGILALCLGLAYLPLAGQARSDTAIRFYRPLRTAAVCVLTAVVIGSVFSSNTYPADPGAAVGRSYVATARIALAQAPAGTVIVDDPVPSDVMGGAFFGHLAMASDLLGPLNNGQQKVRPRFVSTPHGTFSHLMEFDGWGRLEPAVVSGAASIPLAAGKACWPSHGGIMVVKLTSAVQRARILQFDYLSGHSGELTLQFGGRTIVYRYERGLNSAFFPLRASGSQVTIEAMTGRLPCVGDVKAGVLLPSGAGPAIPPLAVNG